MRPGLRHRLAAGETIFVGWLETASPSHAATLARAGCGAVVIDGQHGVAGVEALRDSITAIHGAGASAMIRPHVGDAGMSALALDLGAEGVIAPMINSADEAESFVRSVKYPPLGGRSWGPGGALGLHGLTGPQMLAGANDWTMAIAMIETRQALDAMESIMATPGIDGVLVGPSDLSISLSDGAAVDPGNAETTAACRAVADMAAARGLPAAVFANSPDLARLYRDMGYRMIVMGTDLMLMAHGAGAWLAGARSA